MTACCWHDPRIPLAFKVTIAGVTNRFCSTCANFNGDVICEAYNSNCENYYIGTLSGSACNTTSATISPPSNGSLVFTVPGAAGATYSGSSIEDFLSAGEITLTKQSESSLCSWPATV